MAPYIPRLGENPSTDRTYECDAVEEGFTCPRASVQLLGDSRSGLRHLPDPFDIVSHVEEGRRRMYRAAPRKEMVRTDPACTSVNVRSLHRRGGSLPYTTFLRIRDT